MAENIPPMDSKKYLGLNRWQIANNLRTELNKPDNSLSTFFTKRLWSWIYYYIKNRFGPNHDFLDYSSSIDDKGIYNLKKDITSKNDFISIAIAADWATDTTESDAIGDCIANHNSDYTIHLGDTYFVGEPKEIYRNFLDPDCHWSKGNVGSFVTLGNHEMYARGISFFNDLLPVMGLKKVNGLFTGQKASFVCLQNDYWRILLLDTGYHSDGIPILEMIPWFSPDCHFDDKLMNWLKDDVKLNDSNDKRGIMILTHHQYVTAFKGEDEYIKPASQLASLIGTDRPVLWIWGHEHKLSVFEKTQVKDGVTAYGRCIGNGGMPVELNRSGFIKDNKKNGSQNLIMVDKRQKALIEDTPIGYNGYILLKIKDSKMEIEYYDCNGLLFTEKWNTDEKGIISGIRTAPDNSELTLEEGKSWNGIIQ